MRAFYLYDPWEMEYLKFSTFQQIFDDQIFMNDVTTSSGLIKIYFEYTKILDQCN